MAHLAHLIDSSTERFTKLELEWNKVSSLMSSQKCGQYACCLDPVCLLP